MDSTVKTMERVFCGSPDCADDEVCGALLGSCLLKDDVVVGDARERRTDDGAEIHSLRTLAGAMTAPGVVLRGPRTGAGLRRESWGGRNYWRVRCWRCGRNEKRRAPLTVTRDAIGRALV